MVSISWIKRKIAKALTMIKDRGLLYAIRFIHIFIHEDTWLLGRLVELAGDTGKLDGCTFDLNQPVITTFLKSRFFLKSWEEEARYLFKKYQPVDLPLVEFGASIGIVSCITNKQLADPASHIVVEANPNLLPVLEKNRADNQCEFRVLNNAIAYGSEEVHFSFSDRCNEGLISQTASDITVPTLSLQKILETEGFSKINLICDIEGHEIDLVENEGQFIGDHVDWIIIEVHGQLRADKTQTMLEDHGFQLIEEFENNQIYRNNRWAKKPSDNLPA